MRNLMTRRAGTAALALLLAIMTTAPAPAAEMRCKSDPTILLSDGTIIDLSADIGAPLWEVTSISYVVHIPAGKKAVAVISTPNWPTTIEHFTLVSDGRAGRYDTRTVVETARGGDVTANLIVVPLGGLPRLAATSGWSGQPLRVLIRTSS